MKRTARTEAEPLDLSLERLDFLAITGERQRDRFAVGAKSRHRVDQEVGALDMPELADIDDIGRISRFDDRVELVRRHTVEYAAHQPGRYADGALVGVARELAFEQEQVGAVHQRPFEAAIECALQRIQRVVQRTAMRRIDANGFFRAGLQANESAGFGAMSVQDIRVQPADQAHEMRPHQNVGGKRFAANGETMNAKLEPGRDRRQRRFSPFAAGKAVGDNADMVAAVGLAVGEVQDVTEDSADRRANRVQDTKRLV